MKSPLTRRQMITLAAYADGDRWPTQRELAERFGVSPSAISLRINRAMRKLTPAQAQALRDRTRIGYRKAMSQGGRRVTMKLFQFDARN